MSEDPSEDPAETELVRTIASKEERKIRARSGANRSILSWIGMFGLVGWSVAIPTVLGACLGGCLDRRIPHETISWTLTFLLLGLGAGCLIAWHWIKREGKT